MPGRSEGGGCPLANLFPSTRHETAELLKKAPPPLPALKKPVPQQVTVENVWPEVGEEGAPLRHLGLGNTGEGRPRK